jgi:hypothetical protein
MWMTPLSEDGQRHHFLVVVSPEDSDRAGRVLGVVERRLVLPGLNTRSV